MPLTIWKQKKTSVFIRKHDRKKVIPRWLRLLWVTLRVLRNMTQLAKEAGMTRAGLYKALSAEGNSGFATVSKVAKALGLKIMVQPA